MDEIDIESRGAGSASGQGSKASLRARLAALTALLLAGASLSACGSGRIFDGTTYAGDIQPQSTARITPPDVEEPEFEWPEPGESQLEAASSGAEAAQGPALPSELLAGQGGSAGSEPIETPRAAPASPVEATAVEAPPPPAASPPPPAASPPPPPPLAAPPPPPVSAPPPQPTPAPSPTASATQSQPAPALTALPRPASPEAFPNLADVPERPADVPSPQERASLAAELEQDRASNLGGERPVAPVGGLPAPTGPVPTGGITFGAPAQTTAATPVPTPAPTTPAGPLATIRFAEGSTAVPTEAEGTLRSVARTAAASGATLTVLGRVPTQATDSDALRLANSVAGILLREGMSPLKVIVQGRADIEDGGPLVVVLPQN